MRRLIVTGTTLEASLKRLGVERIDLYQLHCVDRRYPYAELIRALADFQRAQAGP